MNVRTWTTSWSPRRRLRPAALLHGRRLAAGTAATLALVLSSALSVAQDVHAASGGGCDHPGLRVGGLIANACINARGATVNTDGYLRGTPERGCYIQLALLDENYRVITTASPDSCAAGHHVGPSQLEFLGTYHSELCVYDGPYFGCSVSPAQNEP